MVAWVAGESCQMSMYVVEKLEQHRLHELIEHDHSLKILCNHMRYVIYNYVYTY